MLNVHDECLLVFEKDTITIQLLGGVNTEVLDSVYVTLKLISFLDSLFRICNSEAISI